MRSRTAKLALAVLVAGTWASAQTRPPATIVTGVVLDPSDALIPGVSVFLSSGNTDLVRSSTDEKGEFHIEVPQGRYELRFEREGFSTARTRLSAGTQTS